MRRAVILLAISIFLLSASSVFAQEDGCDLSDQEAACDLNQNGVVDVSDLVRIMNYVGGSDWLDSIPKYGDEGDCDCDNLQFSINDLQTILWRMIRGYFGWKRGVQLYSETDIISIPAMDSSPGDEIEIPVYIDTERDLLGLQFYISYDSNLMTITDFTFSDTLLNGYNRTYIFEGGISIVKMNEDYNYNGLIGYLRASIDPDTPVGSEILLAFGNDPHRALYTGLADTYYSDESRIIELHFIHPVKNDGIINVVEGRLRGEDNMSDGLSAFPNPFNNSTNLTFRIERQSRVRIDIFDMLGRRVSNLVNTELSAGSHSVVWDADRLPSGVYFCRLAVDDHSMTTRITLLK